MASARSNYIAGPPSKASPHCLEAERAVLGAALLEPAQVVPVLREQLSESDFYLRAHQLIYKAILDALDAGTPAEGQALLFAVGNLLEDRGQLDEVGGRTYLSDLVTQACLVESVAFYVEQIKDKAVRRKLQSFGLQLSEVACDGLAVGEVLLQARNFFETLSAEVFTSQQGLLHAATFDFPQSSITNFNVVIEGLIGEGDLILWAGYEKHRKSTLVLQACVCIATGHHFLGFNVPQPRKVLYIDMESSDALLARRWESIRALLTEHQVNRIKENLQIVQGRKLLAQGVSLSIDGRGRVTLAGLIESSQAEVIVLDPLRVLHSADEDRSSQMVQVLTEIRRLARHRTVIVVHHCRKRQLSTKASIHLKDDPYLWSDNIRGSNVLKAHADGIVLQELVPDKERDELLYFAAILKDAPNIPPIPLVESSGSPFWHERLAEQSPEDAEQLLSEKDRAILGVARELLQGPKVIPQTLLVNELVARGLCSRATAYRAMGRLGRLGLLAVEAGAIALPLVGDSQNHETVRQASSDQQNLMRQEVRRP
jgi:energy-coupling factor transporter ATP-binding protein EcfA2